MKTVAIVDLETSGLDPATDQILEVGCVLWSVEHCSILECYSSLLPAHSNPAARFNGISEDMLRTCKQDVETTWNVVEWMLERADAIVAHQADFDRAFFEIEGRGWVVDGKAMDWICTIEDFEWPEPTPYKHLIGIALAHGVAVTSAHRAIHDCLLLARCFEQVARSEGFIVDRFKEALARSRRPKAEFVSLAPYEENAVVKAAGFHFRGEDKKWTRRMAVEDAEKLPFSVRET